MNHLRAAPTWSGRHCRHGNELIVPGPPPKPPEQRRRRNKSAAWVDLPAEGRKGRAPKWPIGYPPTAEARKIWNEYWRKPQAVEWERLGCHRTVAMLCVFEDQINAGATTASVLSKHGLLSAELGLTPKALRNLGWVITDDGPVETGSSSTVAAMDDYRKMMREA